MESALAMGQKQAAQRSQRGGKRREAPRTAPHAASGVKLEEHYDWVRLVANHVRKRLNLPFSEQEELVSAGMLGLLEAHKRYAPNKTAAFRTFAFLRVRGAMLDSIRKNSALSLRAYRYSRVLDAMRDYREVSDAEERQRLADSLNDCEHKIEKVLDYAAAGALAYQLTFNEENVSDQQSDTPDIESLIDSKRRLAILRDAIALLPKAEKGILERYYFEGMSFSEIADEQGVGKSWISKCHKRALQRLKRRCLRRRPRDLPNAPLAA